MTSELNQPRFYRMRPDYSGCFLLGVPLFLFGMLTAFCCVMHEETRGVFVVSDAADLKAIVTASPEQAMGSITATDERIRRRREAPDSGSAAWRAAVAVAFGAGAVVLLLHVFGGGYRLDRRGLRRVRLLSRSRRWSWDELRRVTPCAEGIVVETTGHPVRIGPEVPAWAGLAEDLRAALGDVSTPSEGPLVTGAEVQGWLGVPPGGAVRFDYDEPLPWLVAAGVLASFGTCSAGDYGGPGGSRAWPAWLALSLLLAGVAGSWTWGRADGEGLLVRRWLRRRRIPWSAVCGCTVGGRTATVATTLGPVLLPARTRAGRALQRTVDELLAARAAGRALPQHDAGDAALSRAEQAVTAERGLSRGE